MEKENISLSCGEPSSKRFLKLFNVPIAKANPPRQGDHNREQHFSPSFKNPDPFYNPLS